MKALGLKASADEVKKLMSEADEDGNGAIDFHEFKKMLEAFHFFGSLATWSESGETLGIFSSSVVHQSG